MYKSISGVFSALAHPARTQIIDMLGSGERCVCEIVEALGLEQSNVSRHLSTLRQQNLVASRKDGGRVIYRLTCPCIGELLIAAKRVATERPGLPKDAVSG